MGHLLRMKESIDGYVNAFAFRNSKNRNYLGNGRLKINSYTVSTIQVARAQPARESTDAIGYFAVGQPLRAVNECLFPPVSSRAVPQQMPNQKVHFLSHWISQNSPAGF